MNEWTGLSNSLSVASRDRWNGGNVDGYISVYKGLDSLLLDRISAL